MDDASVSDAVMRMLCEAGMPEALQVQEQQLRLHGQMQRRQRERAPMPLADNRRASTHRSASTPRLPTREEAADDLALLRDEAEFGWDGVDDVSESESPDSALESQSLLASAVSLECRISLANESASRDRRELLELEEECARLARECNQLRDQLVEAKLAPHRLHPTTWNEEEKTIVGSQRYHLQLGAYGGDAVITPVEVTAALLETNPVKHLRLAFDRLQVVSEAAQRFFDIQAEQAQRRRDKADAEAWDAKNETVEIRHLQAEIKLLRVADSMPPTRSIQSSTHVSALAEAREWEARLAKMTAEYEAKKRSIEEGKREVAQPDIFFEQQIKLETAALESDLESVRALEVSQKSLRDFKHQLSSTHAAEERIRRERVEEESRPAVSHKRSAAPQRRASASPPPPPDQKRTKQHHHHEHKDASPPRSSSRHSRRRRDESPSSHSRHDHAHTQSQKRRKSSPRVKLEEKEESSDEEETLGVEVVDSDEDEVERYIRTSTTIKTKKANAKRR